MLSVVTAPKVSGSGVQRADAKRANISYLRSACLSAGVPAARLLREADCDDTANPLALANALLTLNSSVVSTPMPPARTADYTLCFSNLPCAVPCLAHVLAHPMCCRPPVPTGRASCSPRRCARGPACQALFQEDSKMAMPQFTRAMLYRLNRAASWLARKDLGRTMVERFLNPHSACDCCATHLLQCFDSKVLGACSRVGRDCLCRG